VKNKAQTVNGLRGKLFGGFSVLSPKEHPHRNHNAEDGVGKPQAVESAQRSVARGKREGFTRLSG
jgi:hypothetical protein